MLCHYAGIFPPRAALFMDGSTRLRRRFREETITDMLMAGLLALEAFGIIVDFPDERQTGADMEWHFVNLAGPGSHFCLSIQAKSLYAKQRDWQHHSYSKLLYRVGGKSQAHILVNNARRAHAQGIATYPFFAFYNPQRSCADAAGANIEIEGVNIADGFVVESLIRKANDRASRTAVKRVGTLHPYFYALKDLLCAGHADEDHVFQVGPNYGVALVATMMPSPEFVRQEVVRLRERLVDRGLVSADDFPEVPEVSAVPDGIQRRIDLYLGRAPIDDALQTKRRSAIFLTRG